LESALQHAKLVAFTRKVDGGKVDAVYQLVTALAALAAGESFATVETLARCPDFLQFLCTRLGPNFSAAEFLRALDRLHTRHLPSSLTEARRHAPDNMALQMIAELQGKLTSETFPPMCRQRYRKSLGARRFDLGTRLMH